MKSQYENRDKERSSELHQGRPSRTVKTLRELRVGDVAHIVDFAEPNDIAKKIEAMGLRRGKEIEVLQRLGRGILVKASNSRIVITADLAKNIEVK